MTHERPSAPAPVRKLVIVGGGSAGWMTAAAASAALHRDCEIVLVESEEIGIVGVGEATIPAIRSFNQFVGIDEAEFMRATQGSFKLGIEFVNWLREGHAYFHPFGAYGRNFDWAPLYQYYLQARANGDDTPLQDYSLAWLAARENRFTHPAGDQGAALSTLEYAFHFDATLYGRFLRRIAEGRGVKRVEGRVANVRLRAEDGAIEGLDLDDGRTVDGDFFVDCTGFRGLLIEEALKTGYEDWTHWLPCDRAIAAPCASGGDFTPYTRSTARQAGWQWRIPLQHRTGNGYVHSSGFISQQDATDTLVRNLDGALLAEPRLLKFVTGRRRKAWNKNCVAIGLSAGFMEPLESTSLHLIQTGVVRFLALFPGRDPDPWTEMEYNKLVREEWEPIRDFLILHYHANQREDGELWRYCREMAIPETLAYRIEQFQRCGRLVSPGLELFLNANWISVLMGQGIMPERYEALLHHRQVDGRAMLAQVRTALTGAAGRLPSHRDYINRFCKAPEEALQPIG